MRGEVLVPLVGGFLAACLEDADADAEVLEAGALDAEAEAEAEVEAL